MKESFQCPKCNSTAVVEVLGQKYSQQNVPLNAWQTKIGIQDRYICCSCGYTEEYTRLTPEFNKWAENALKKQTGKDGFV